MPFALYTCCPLFSLNIFFLLLTLYQALHNLAAHSCLEVLHVYLYESFGKEARQSLSNFGARSDIYYVIQCVGSRQIASFDVASCAKLVY